MSKKTDVTRKDRSKKSDIIASQSSGRLDSSKVVAGFLGFAPLVFVLGVGVFMFVGDGWQGVDDMVSAQPETVQERESYTITWMNGSNSGSANITLVPPVPMPLRPVPVPLR